MTTTTPISLFFLWKCRIIKENTLFASRSHRDHFQCKIDPLPSFASNQNPSQFVSSFITRKSNLILMSMWFLLHIKRLRLSYEMYAHNLKLIMVKYLCEILDRDHGEIEERIEQRQLYCRKINSISKWKIVNGSQL